MSLRRVILCVFFVSLIHQIACGDAQTPDAKDVSTNNALDIQTIELRQLDASNAVVATAHHGHWHGDLPMLDVDGPAFSFELRLLDESNTEVLLDYSTYTLSGRLVNETHEGFLSIESDEARFNIIPGSEPGENQMVFQIHSMAEVLYETPALDVIILESDAISGENNHTNNHHNDTSNNHNHTPPDGHDHGPHEFPGSSITDLQLVTKDNDIAAYSDHDHWHGSLPVLTINGEPLVLDVYFLDAEQERVDVDYGHFILGARVDENHDDSLLTLSDSENQLEVTPGDTPGTTMIYVQLWYHGIVVYESPALDVAIE